MQLEGTKKVNKVKTKYVRDEEGRLLRDKGRIRERVRFFRSLLDAKSDMLDPDIPKRLLQQPVASALGIEHTEEIAIAMKATANRESSGTGPPSRETAETRTSTRSDPPAGAPPTYPPHLAQGESPTVMERRGHYRTPHEGRQDGVRKLPRHFARITHTGKVLLKVVARRLERLL